MAIEPSEIVPGAVAYFNVHKLNRSRDIWKPERGIPRPGPFVCIESDEDEWATFTPLTSQWNPDRLPIPRSWRSGGADKWLRDATMFLVDGQNTYIGHWRFFTWASAGELLFDPGRRPNLTEVAVQAILDEVRRCGGRLLEDVLDNSFGGATIWSAR